MGVYKWPVFLFFFVPLFWKTNCYNENWTELVEEFKVDEWCNGGYYCQFSKEISSKETELESTGVALNQMSTISQDLTTNTESRIRKCQCDEKCDEYGDCCYDYAAVVKNRAIKNTKEEPWTCLPLRVNRSRLDEKYHIYMIDDCPEDWTDVESLSIFCRKDLTLADGYSYLLDVPVWSYDTNRTYANVYCARCHSDSAHLAKWNVSVDCEKNVDEYSPITREDLLFESSTYMPGLRKWSINVNQGESIFCHMIIEQFDDFDKFIEETNSRTCLPGIESCPVGWTDEVVTFKCQAYTLLVQSINITSGVKTLYRNPHCAKCNDVPLDSMECYSKTPAIYRSVFFGNKGKGRAGYSFSMLFDFEFGGGSGVGRTTQCKAEEIYDHFHDRCHAVICGAGFVNQMGVCLARNQSEDENNYGNRDSLENSWLNSSCQRLILQENDDFIRLKNGSLVLNLTGQMYHPSEYESTPDGRNVTICAEGKQVDTYFRFSSDGQRFLSDVCLAVSVVCLALHIAIHTVLPKLRNLPGKNLLSLSCALFIAQLLFLTSIGLREVVGYGLCATLGVLTHWSYLAAFFWMNVMGFDICRTFAGSLTRHRGIPGRGQRSTFRFYSLYAWGLPTLIVVLGVALDLSHPSEDFVPQYGYSHFCWMDDWAPAYGARVCWISNRSGLGVFFVLPVAILLLENMILFSVTVISILKQRRASKFALEKNQTYRKASEMKQPSVTDRLQPPGQSGTSNNSHTNNKQQIRFILYIKLGLILGLGWIFGFAAALAKVSVLWYPFIFFNALQGTFIFVAFACKRKVYFMMYHWVTNRHHPSDTSSSSRTTPSSNKPTTQRVSYATSSSVATDYENAPKRQSSIDIHIHQSTPPSPVLAEGLVPQAAAIEIVRQWIQSASPASRVKRNLPRVIITKHFYDDDCPPPPNAPHPHPPQDRLQFVTLDCSK